MAYTVKDWQDSPSTTTPLSAVAIEDLETRTTGYTFARVVAGGNLGAAYTFNLANDSYVFLTGTLNANCTITVSGRTTGARFRLLLTQDATGGRTLTVSDGTTPQAVTIATTASATVAIDGSCPNTSDVWISAP